MIEITVIFGKDKHTLSVAQNGTVLAMKEAITELTSVPPNLMKLTCKGFVRQPRDDQLLTYVRGRRSHSYCLATIYPSCSK